MSKRNPLNGQEDPHARLERLGQALTLAVFKHVDAEFRNRRGTPAGHDFRAVFDEIWLRDFEGSFLEMVLATMENCPDSAAVFVAGLGMSGVRRNDEKIIGLAEAFVARRAAAAALATINAC